MSNTVLTHEKVAKLAAPMLVEESQFIKAINREREKEFGTNQGGYTAGRKVRIKVPPIPVVTDGATVVDADSDINMKERYVELAVDTQKHVSLQFTSVEKALDITDFKERFLRPAIRSLATNVDADLLRKAIVTVNNFTLIGGSEAHPLAPFGRAREMMARNLAPDDARISLLSSGLTNTLIDSSGTLFNPTAEISKQYKEGYIGRARGFEFVESEHIWTQQYGSKTTGITVSGPSQTGGNLVIGNVVNGDTFKAGQVFTIAGVYQLHPITRQSTGRLMQFTILKDVTSAGTTAQLNIFPEITPHMINTDKQANATVDASPANSAVITFSAAAGSVIDQALCFQKHAFGAAFVPLEVQPSSEGYSFNADTMALRVMSGGDWKTDKGGTRIDVLYGFGTVRGNHAARVGLAR